MQPEFPVMIRGEFVCPSILSAMEQCINSAKADVLKLTEDQKEAEKLDINDDTALGDIHRAGYHIRWLKGMDDYPKEEQEEGGVSRPRLPTHRTMCLYHARSKEGDWFHWGSVGTARPVRYYVLSTVQMVGGVREDFSDDDETMRSHSEDEVESYHDKKYVAVAMDRASSSSSSSDTEEEVPVRHCQYPNCKRGTMHFHAKTNRRRPRPRGLK
jgi:hypothetical protein